MIEVKVDSRQVLDALKNLERKTGNLRPALKEIGEDLMESTKRRFATSTAPDGTPWEANSPVTIARYLGQTGGNYKKDGSLTKRGAGRAGSKNPLIGETKELSSSIGYQVTANTVAVGSPMEYAAMQQFGGKKSEFPHLWGDIPARPFLGLSDDDEAKIVGVVRRYLSGSFD
jgi:phage virion morphogenesis protein